MAEGGCSETEEVGTLVEELQEDPSMELERTRGAERRKKGIPVPSRAKWACDGGSRATRKGSARSRKSPTPQVKVSVMERRMENLEETVFSLIRELKRQPIFASAQRRPAEDEEERLPTPPDSPPRSHPEDEVFQRLSPEEERPASPRLEAKKQGRFRRKLVPTELKVKYNGDSETLAGFVNQAQSFVSRFHADFERETDKIWVVGAQLEGPAAIWLNSLHQSSSPALSDFELFIKELKDYFGDPLSTSKAQTDLLELKQGDQTVAEYGRKFKSLAARIPLWPDVTLVHFFQRGLRPEIFRACTTRSSPETLRDWLRVAGEVEATERSIRTQARQYAGEEAIPGESGRQRSNRETAGRPPQTKTPFSEEREKRMRLGLCLRCGEKGHLIAQCSQNKKTSSNPTATISKNRTKVQKAVALAEFRPGTKQGDHSATSTEEEEDTDCQLPGNYTGLAS